MSVTNLVSRAAVQLAGRAGADQTHVAVVAAVSQFLLRAGVRLDDPAADLSVRVVDGGRRGGASAG